MFEVVRDNEVISRHKTREAVERVMKCMMNREVREIDERNVIYDLLGWDCKVRIAGMYYIR